jgi:hypothetical protein
MKEFRIGFIFVSWVVLVCITMFYEADWKNFSWSNDWEDFLGRIIVAIIWTIVVYGIFLYGHGDMAVQMV